MISYTSDNEFFKGKTETFSVIRFLLELTQHIPPRGSQYIRRYGLYTSRTKGKWPEMPHVMRLAPPPLPDGRLSICRLLSRYNLTMKNQLFLIKKAVPPVENARKGRPSSLPRYTKLIRWSVLVVPLQCISLRSSPSPKRFARFP